jgi:hypothetical protein
VQHFSSKSPPSSFSTIDSLPAALRWHAWRDFAANVYVLQRGFEHLLKYNSSEAVSQQATAEAPSLALLPLTLLNNGVAI